MKLARSTSEGSTPRTNQRRNRQGGWLMAELVVAMAIVAIGMLPILGAYAQIHKSVRQSYQRAVAMELVDGEMELLLAGEWREFQPGPQQYTLHGASTTNLPPGKTTLTITGNRVRLEWQPDKRDLGGKVTREGTGK